MSPSTMIHKGIFLHFLLPGVLMGALPATTHPPPFHFPLPFHSTPSLHHPHLFHLPECGCVPVQTLIAFTLEQVHLKP